jgi:hypothetical protein
MALVCLSAFHVLKIKMLANDFQSKCSTAYAECNVSPMRWEKETEVSSPEKRKFGSENSYGP